MAHQIIFTSSVRGIKPGASGYCTVLRSPGVRPALEQALEKISVFEHSQCNQGRTIYSYRNLAIRDKAYHVLSRVSDAGKDYTGRTNFLAHHLVFEKEELPEQSPGDLLLYWPHWCKKWEGEPREAPVDSGSIKNTVVTKPPVKMWREQGSGIDGAVRLANETDTSLILRSKTRTDETLLQLIVEALAVRAKFNKSSAFAWTTSFSVGLAVQGHAKNFRWLALRASDDYSLPSSGEVFDLDAAVSGPSSANEELIAIAREGHFKPPQKPIPLTHERGTSDRSVPIQGAKPSQQIPTKRKIKLGLGDGRRSNRHVGDTGGATATKRSAKKPVLALVALLLILSVFAGGYWFYKLQKTSAANTEYEKQIELMIDLNDQWKRDGDTAISIGKVEELFKNIHDAAGRPTKTHKDMMNIEWERLSRDYDEREKEIATYAFQEFIEILKNPNRLADKRKENIGVESPLYESEKTDLPKAEMAATGSETSSRSESSAPAETDEEDQVALNLQQYSEIILRAPGELIPIDEQDYLLYIDNLKVAKLEALGRQLLASDLLEHKQGRSLIDPKSPIPKSSESYAIELNYANDNERLDLIIIVGNSLEGDILLGEYPLIDLSAGEAIELLRKKFKTDQLEMRLIDDKKEPFTNSSAPKRPGSGFGRTDEYQVNSVLFDAMVKDASSASITTETLEEFDRWSASRIERQLKALIDDIEESKADSKGKPTKEKNEELVKAYRNILRDLQSAKEIEAYFIAYGEELKRIKDLVDSESDDSKKRLLDAVYKELHNDERKKDITIKNANDSVYKISWRNNQWGLSKSNAPRLLKRRSKEDLSSDLESHLNMLEKEEAIKLEQEQYNEAIREFNEVTREWKRIEFKRPGPGPDGQIITVEVK